MSIKDKIMNIVAAHPKLIILGIGLTITFVVGTAMGMIDHNSVFAFRSESICIADPKSLCVNRYV